MLRAISAWKLENIVKFHEMIGEINIKSRYLAENHHHSP